MIFETMEQKDYEQLVFCQDEVTGLKAIICIHDTTLGPALGGCRVRNDYESEEEAIEDAMNLARGMTYKNAAAGLNLGGGKTVVMGAPDKQNEEAFYRALGRYVNTLNGRYYTAEDVGTSEHEMNLIYKETPYVCGTSKSFGSAGNPSPMTAYGIYIALKRTVAEKFDGDKLEGKTVAVQGVGHVSYELCRLLNEDGVKLIVTDINKDNAQRAVDDFGAEFVEPDDIFSVDADIFAPCALGGVLNDDTIPQLKVKAVCGSANNQLKDEDKHSKMLEEKGILYAPDYIVNSGGVINTADELNGYNEERAKESIENIDQILKHIFDISSEHNETSLEASQHFAETRMKQISHIKDIRK
ncbi:Leu/Phe/Val dehydrogenase [Staphylococcus capitis]|uniref:Leu/Phe/Val dehydrogenase n=1 Tax=Staphylococcus capitis TaxID=29388 RepID=UPI001D15C8EF|nr:Glu/Leu/Phe/Val dehydrogenase [Staphylococcus capitis]MCC3689671.1 leucine dehydrogenase [Staphylococcus capitis]MCC3695206.1 leucine dehydrogenase [Staphylococcus capitis]MCC9111829.1 leucine dehydrogenase [Staphylococcus capitis]MDH8827706.1 Glu/Leu/Phe/Val dehydrogenase [Staphylococcus capitis]MDH8925807.1 Glu/Leu/Phe/Val dehydrogenase [Staphylococcus capitis]